MLSARRDRPPWPGSRSGSRSGKRSGRWAGTGLAVLSACCFGTVGPVTRLLTTAGLTALQVAQLRLTVAAALLLAYGAATGRRLVPKRREWPAVAVLGLISFAALQVLCGVSVARIPIGMFVVVQYLAPALVVLWVRTVRGTAQPRRVWAGAALVPVGLLLAGQVWGNWRLDPLGVLAAAGVAAALAVRFLVVGSALARSDPLTLATAGLTVGAVAVNVWSLPTSFPYPVLGQAVQYGGLVFPVWALACWVALVATLLAYLTGIAAQVHLPPTAASPLASLETVAGVATAALLLGEEVSAARTAGLAIVLTGALIAQNSMRTQPPRRSGDRKEPTPWTSPAHSTSGSPPTGKRTASARSSSRTSRTR
ncbi:EamA family transporter [Streptomyces sp. NPDC059002]|uniref:EamA family transporter n=1 Tax=Streptomyces sp. NPDC059002 TaxID=3346690 RepID=UPI00367F1898